MESIYDKDIVTFISLILITLVTIVLLVGFGIVKIIVELIINRRIKRK